MRRIEFIRIAGRWSMLLFLLAAGGYLLASRSISFRNDCNVDADCALCGLKRVCRKTDEKKVK